jgi:Zn-dependent protease with chaperone function
MGTAERLVRTLYSIVIWITSLHFYISIPLLILVMVAVTGGTLYLYFVIGRIPLYLVLAVGLAALYILFSVIRSVLVRVEDREPGRSLPRDEARLLWGTAEEVAERVGTRPVQAIYITPGAEIVILERGGLLKKLRGAGQRCLILGLGALPGMTQGQFKAILAHEYGHFTNRDTAGGKLAVRVRASVYRMAYSMTTTGQAHWYNPVWWFVNGFYRVFLRITLGASRLQEILADRFAAMSYGVHDFVDGLTHIARQSLAFEMRASREIEQATEQRRGLLNLYTLSPLESNSQGELETKVQEVMSQPTSPYDSHPAVRERIELVKQLQASEKVGPGNQEPVWGLLPSADVLQSEMTAIVQKEIQEQL